MASWSPAPSASNYTGYWIANSAGLVASCGWAPNFGVIGFPLARPIVGIEATPDGLGYWLVASDGGVFAFGIDARFFGSTGSIHLNKPIVGMASTPSGNGYWLAASDGGVFAFGIDARFFGSTGSIHLNKPIVGMASTPSGNGYWLVASDGGIFSYGDANFYGSTGSIHLNKPIVGMASTPSGNGYWLVASDGGIFSYGDANFYGSTGSIHLNKPIVGMASDAITGGYWFVASDGGTFAFGAPFQGSAIAPPGLPPPPPASAICTATPSDPNPEENTDVIVNVTSNVPNALALATVYFPQGAASFMGHTDGSGNVSIYFAIYSDVPVGSKTVVAVSIASATCLTSFTPTPFVPR